MRALIHHSARSFLGQREEWWYLIGDQGAEPHVEHVCWLGRRGSSRVTEVSRRYTLEQAAKSLPSKARRRLRTLLAQVH